MNLKTLRQQHPQIKARSINEFLERLEISGVKIEMNEPKVVKKDLNLRLHFKEYFYKLIDNDIEKAYRIFQDQEDFNTAWRKEPLKLDEALIKLYYDLFNEKVKKTSCRSCINNRIYRVRKHLRRYTRR